MSFEIEKKKARRGLGVARNPGVAEFPLDDDPARDGGTNASSLARCPCLSFAFGLVFAFGKTMKDLMVIVCATFGTLAGYLEGSDFASALPVFRVIDTIFVWVFLAELLVRILVERCNFVKDIANWCL